MKKRMVGVVFLLVAALGLMGAVSAGGNVALGDDVPLLDGSFGGACHESVFKCSSGLLSHAKHLNVVKSNHSDAVNKSGDSEVQESHEGIPVNVLYNLAAILLICVIFAVGYCKR